MPADECAVVRVAALLHDVGHYPFSHALEEIGALHHEEVARPLITDGEVAEVLARTIGPTRPSACMRSSAATAIARCRDSSPARSISTRSIPEARRAHVRRAVRRDRRRAAAALAHHRGRSRRPAHRRWGSSEKGLAALESLLFAKYQMYRNVYWHHAVRSATAMYKRLVDDALRGGAIEERELAGFTDEGLLHRLEERAPSPLIDALRNRRLHKRAFELSAAELPAGHGDWIAGERTRVLAAEDALARELGVAPGAVLLDYPVKPRMLGLDLPVRMRGGEVRRLGRGGCPRRSTCRCCRRSCTSRRESCGCLRWRACEWRGSG